MILRTELRRFLLSTLRRLFQQAGAGSGSLRPPVFPSSTDRFALCESAGAAFYDFGHDAAAVRIFRRALAFNDDAGVATTVAWILATSSNDSLRDGIAALALVHPIAQNEPDDPTVLSALGAAHAELGQYPQAVTAAERALAIVRAGGDRSAESLLQKRLAAYRANRPWRQ